MVSRDGVTSRWSGTRAALGTCRSNWSPRRRPATAAALEELLITHSIELARHITGNLPPALQSQVGVDDILQQVYVDVFRGMTGFASRSEEAFVAWLQRIADSRLRDALKKVTREKRAETYRRVGRTADDQSSSVVELVDLLSASGALPSGSAARHEAVQAVQVGIAGLPQDQRDAVRLHVLQGLSLGETAALDGSDQRRRPRFGLSGQTETAGDPAAVVTMVEQEMTICNPS